MRIKIILFFVWLAYSTTLAFGSENIRVALADNRKSVVLASNSGSILMEGWPLGRNEKRLVLTAASVRSRTVRVRSSGELIQVDGKSYRGWVEIRKKRNGLFLIVNDLDIEDYLLGVVSSEIPPGWQFEALKAQAVAARTYALYQKRMAGHKPYHILATVNSQVYAGSRCERPRGAQAVRETKGLVIVYHGDIIPAFYHSSCGGHTEDASELWGIDAPYLKGVDCDCQEISRYGLWEKRIGKVQLIKALRRQGYRINNILGMSIEGITPAGRVREIAVRSSSGGNLIVPAESLRAALGNDLVPSVFFELEWEGNEAVFSGRGAGHGVGLCQWGAEEMAEKGYTFRSILSHYYPGTSLKQLW